MNKFTLLITSLLFVGTVYGQQKTKNGATLFGKKVSQEVLSQNNGLIRCATTEYEEYLRTQSPNRQTTEEFEAWIAPKIQEILQQRNISHGTDNVYSIPVVVHVIHNGDPYGVQENIRDEQVLSQITVLNQDFRRMLGTPGFNVNPVGADTEIEFCMAKRDPDGNPTTGINRVQRPENTWSETAIQSTLKPQTIWDPTRYFNIWVVNFTGGQLLGYAQFPTGSGLPGLPSTGAANTDGVVIGYQFFGSSAIYPQGNYSAPFDRGRTATHEVGHFFGLRHIWGDGGCEADDFCNDTPNSASASEGCPFGKTTCGSLDMIENYMDYSDDACMNVFTNDQKIRMMAVLQNSPRRASLLTSNACAPPNLELDAGLSVGDLNIDNCQTNFAPTLVLSNGGSTAITSVDISYNLTGSAPQTFNWTGNLANGQNTNITLPNITTAPGNQTFNATITAVNGGADDFVNNNSVSQAFTFAVANVTEVTFKLQQDNFGTETTWNLKNSAGTTLYSGGPYTNSQNPALITQTWSLQNNQCYTFTINDSYGDGICCEYGNGYYEILSGSTVIAEGGSFSNTDIKRFSINLLSTNDFEIFGNLYLYPNPSKDVVNIAMNESLGLPESYVIYNTLGQIVGQKVVNSAADLSINTSNLSNGVYLIKVTKENTSKTLQFIKN